MMLNAMSPQRHHQQTVSDSPLLLTNSPSISNISSPPSSTSSVSSSSNCNSAKNDSTAISTSSNNNNNSSSSSSNSSSSSSTSSSSSSSSSCCTSNGNSDSSTSHDQSKSNMAIPNKTASTKVANPSNNSSSNSLNHGGATSNPGNAITFSGPIPRTKSTTATHSSHYSHNHHNHQNHHQHQNQQLNHHSHEHPHLQSHQHHYSTYQASRFEYHHSNHHHHSSSYSGRNNGTNQRGHSGLNDHHSHYHHLNHSSINRNNNNNNNTNSNTTNNYNSSKHSTEIVTSVSSPSWQASKNVTSSNSAPITHQRHHEQMGPPYYVDLHVNAGECVSLQLIDGQEQVVAGPATITMVSQQQTPPVPIPVQVPPGHMVHQIADESGTLKHIILSIMNTNDDGSQMNNSLINLPSCTFRIDSRGEVVSVDSRDESMRIPLSSAQPGYYASYDGCPISYESPMSREYISHPAVSSSSDDQPVTNVTNSSNQVVDQLESADNQQQGRGTKQNSLHENKNTGSGEISDKVVGDNTHSNESVTGSQVKDSNKTKVLHGRVIVDKSSTTSLNPYKKGKSRLTTTENQAPNKVDTIRDNSVNEMNQSSQPKAEQMVVTNSFSDINSVPPYISQQHAQVMATGEVDMINGTLPHMVAAVDGQFYSYPPCCCVCYCDPQENAPSSTHFNHQESTILGSDNQNHNSRHGRSLGTGQNHHGNNTLPYHGKHAHSSSSVHHGSIFNNPSGGPPTSAQQRVHPQANHQVESTVPKSRNSMNTGGYKYKASNQHSIDGHNHYNNHYFPNHHQGPYNSIVTTDSRQLGQYHHPVGLDTSPSFSQALLSTGGPSMMVGANNIYSTPVYQNYGTGPNNAATHIVASNTHGSRLGSGPVTHHHQGKSQNFRNGLEHDNIGHRHNNSNTKDQHQHSDNSQRISNNRSPHMENKKQQSVTSDKITGNSNSRRNNLKVSSLTAINQRQRRRSGSQTDQQPQSQPSSIRVNQNIEAPQDKSEKVNLKSTSVTNREQASQRKQSKINSPAANISKEYPKSQAKKNPPKTDQQVTSTKKDSHMEVQSPSNSDSNEKLNESSLVTSDTKEKLLVGSVEISEESDLKTNDPSSIPTPVSTPTPKIDTLDHSNDTRVEVQGTSPDELERSSPSTISSELRDSEGSETKSTKGKRKKSQNLVINQRSTVEEAQEEEIVNLSNLVQKTEINAKSTKSNYAVSEPMESLNISPNSEEQEKSSSNKPNTHIKTESNIVKNSNGKEHSGKSNNNNKSNQQKHKEKDKGKGSSNLPVSSKKSLGNLKSTSQRSNSIETSTGRQSTTNRANHSNTGSTNTVSSSNNLAWRNDGAISSSKSSSSHTNYLHNNHLNNHGHSNSRNLSTKVSSQLRACRSKSTAMVGKIAQSFLSSNIMIASVGIIMFSCFSMLLALLIHVCIIKPLTE